MREPRISAPDHGPIPMSQLSGVELRIVASGVQLEDDPTFDETGDTWDHDFAVRYAAQLLRERGL